MERQILIDEMLGLTDENEPLQVGADVTRVAWCVWGGVGMVGADFVWVEVWVECDVESGA